MPISLAVHGGAWNIPDDAVDASREGVRHALEVGWDLLNQGGSALEVVEQVVRTLEDDPHFDAGRGSRVNSARSSSTSTMTIARSSCSPRMTAAA